MEDNRQGQFNEFINEVLKGEPDTYASVVSMVYTLIEDGHLEELHRIFKIKWPEYYHESRPPMQTEN